MLDIFITPRVRRKIVIIYAKFPDFKSHTRALAKLIQEDQGNVCRELQRLEKIGFLKTSKVGNTKVYATNRHFVLFKDLQSLVLKSQLIQFKATKDKSNHYLNQPQESGYKNQLRQ